MSYSGGSPAMPNNRLEKDLRPARYAREAWLLSLCVSQTKFPRDHRNIAFDPFEIVASALTARAFLEPLGPPLRADMTFDQANDLLVSAWDASGFAYEPVDRVSLVYRQTQLAGWYSMDMYDSDLDIIGEVVHPIHADEIASADTPALKLVHILAERPRSGIIVFVLEEDAIVGTVSPEMFWGHVFRLCLFALHSNSRARHLQLPCGIL